MNTKDSQEPKCNKYQSYLLRMWKDGENGEWRAFLLTIPTQERHHFANLEALFDFLNNNPGNTGFVTS